MILKLNYKTSIYKNIMICFYKIFEKILNFGFFFSFFLIIKTKKKNPKYSVVKALKNCPQKKGICTKVLIHTPKKPSSARRKVMRVRISSKKFVFAYIPGEGEQTLRAFSRVLIRGGTRPYLPGVHYIIIRGKFDLNFLSLRRQGRSKYGMKALFYSKKKDRSNAFLNYTKMKKEQFEKILINFQNM
jgi:small subunit ribosomal protein S12